MEHYCNGGYIGFCETIRNARAAGETSPTGNPVAEDRQVTVGSCTLDWGIKEFGVSMAAGAQEERVQGTSTERDSGTTRPSICAGKGSFGTVALEGAAESRIRNRPLDVKTHHRGHLETVSYSVSSQPCLADPWTTGMELSKTGTPCKAEGRNRDRTMEAGAVPCHKKNARLGAHLVFIDESGFLLIPNVRRTWAPKGQTPHFYHWLKQDRISAISALSVSPHHRHIGLYIQFRSHNLTHRDVKRFLQHLMRHLPGRIVLLWDRGTIHKQRSLQLFLNKHKRLHSEFFPPYAPELNPTEYVWNRSDFALSNRACNSREELHLSLLSIAAKLRSSQNDLWSCVHASDLSLSR